MITNLVEIPDFIRDIHFKELEPSSGNCVYRYITLEDITITFQKGDVLMPEGYYMECFDEKGDLKMKLTTDSIIIYKGCKWDGCSPKKWWNIWWGTPDFEETIIASLFHDMLLMFHQTDEFPLSRENIDHIFNTILEMNDFPFTFLYFFGARIGSKFTTYEYKNVETKLIIEKIG